MKLLENCPYVHRAAVESPVALAIVRAGDRTNATTVSFFSEVAHHPTSLWIAISSQSFTHALLTEKDEFSLVTLQNQQAKIAVACGTESGRKTDKCGPLDLYDNGSGFLFLREALASTACRIFRRVPMGDHTLFLAKILSGDVYRARRNLRNLLISDLKAL